MKHEHRGEFEKRGGRGPRVFAPGDLKLLLLSLIAEQPCHGYDLIRRIEKGGAVPLPFYSPVMDPDAVRRIRHASNLWR